MTQPAWMQGKPVSGAPAWSQGKSAAKSQTLDDFMAPINEAVDTVKKSVSEPVEAIGDFMRAPSLKTYGNAVKKNVVAAVKRPFDLANAAVSPVIGGGRVASGQATDSGLLPTPHDKPVALPDTGDGVKRYYWASDPKKTPYEVPQKADGKPDYLAIKPKRMEMAQGRKENQAFGDNVVNLALFATPAGKVAGARAEPLVNEMAAVKPAAQEIGNAFAGAKRPVIDVAKSQAELERLNSQIASAEKVPGQESKVETLKFLRDNEQQALEAHTASEAGVPGNAFSQTPAPRSANLPARPVKLTKVQRGASKKVAEVMKGAKVDPDTAFADNGLTPAENIGTGAEGILMAAGRRPGETGKELIARLDQRTASLPRRLEEGAQAATGVDRMHIEGDIDRIRAEAQARAKPYYEAYAELGPMSSSELESLLATPYGKKLMKGALENARNSRAPEADIQVLQEMVDGLATDAGPRGNPSDYLDQAQEFLQARHVSKALKKALGPSLSDHLAATGGLRDSGGDVAAMDGHILHKDTPFKRKLVRPDGRGLDDAAVAAWEAGYFPHHKIPPEPGELLEALRQDIAGKKTYAKGAGETGALAARVENFETKLARYGVDPTGKTAKQIASELAEEEALVRSYSDLDTQGSASEMPEQAIVEKPVPTPRVLDDVKKFADQDYLQREEAAKIKGAHPEDWSKNKLYVELKSEIRKLAEGKGFDYKGMMAAGGEAPRLREAYVGGKSLIERNDARKLIALADDMSSVEKKAALGGFIKGVLDDMAARQKFDASKLRLYSTDDFAARIAYMSGGGGKERARQFQTFMKALIKEREGMRLRPRTNSVTGDIAEGSAELDAAAGPDIDVSKIPTSKGGVVKLGLDQVNKVLDRVRAGHSAEVRNEIGRQLMDPEYGRKAYQDYLASLSRGKRKRLSGAARRKKKAAVAAGPVNAFAAVKPPSNDMNGQ